MVIRTQLTLEMEKLFFDLDPGKMATFVKGPFLVHPATSYTPPMAVMEAPSIKDTLLNISIRSI